MKFVVAEKIDDVVKIAGTGAFGERPHFLSEDLLIAVAAGMHALLGAVGVGVRDRSIDWQQYQHFVAGQVELDSWQISRTLGRWDLIEDPSFSGRATSRILEDPRNSACRAVFRYRSAHRPRRRCPETSPAGIHY